jgi:hypothetical protein
MQLAPFKPENAPRTAKTAENPDLWNGKNAFSLISSNATYPTAVRTKTRDAKGGDSATIFLPANQLSSRSQFVDQPNFTAGHHFLNIEQNQHPRI